MTKDEKQEERRRGPADRRLSPTDRRGNDRVVEETSRRAGKDRRQKPD